MRNHKKTTIVFLHFARIIENVRNGNSQFCLFLLPFPLFPVLSPKNRARPRVHLASKLMKSLCCVSISDLTKMDKKRGGKGNKQISAFEDVSNM